ncbi:MAG: hypothetical protein V1811_02025, partial [Candidatus Micrarchaeota archaeon]
MGLSQAWRALENKFFSFMEWIEEKLKIPVIKYFVEPLEKHGIPSLAVFILLLAFLAGSAFFLVESPSSEVRIFVKSGNAPIAGVQVQVFDGEKALGSAITGANGEVVFSGLPKKLLLFKTTAASGYSDSEQWIDVGKQNEFTVQLKGGTNAQFQLTVLDSFDGTPVNGASIEYSFGSAAGTAQTNNRGVAEFDLSGSGILYLTVSAAGFKTKTSSLVLSKLQGVVQLERTSERNPYLQFEKEKAKTELQFEMQGTVIVFASGEGKTPVAGGTAILYDSQTGKPLAEAPVS